MKKAFATLGLIFLVLATGLLTPGELRAQEPTDIVISDLDIPVPKWGKQNATFVAENKSEYLRYLAIVSTIRFEGIYMNPVRSTRTHVLLEPGAKVPVITKIEIPGNYGKAQLDFNVYDVFDTLDALNPSQIVYHQPITLRFNVPPGVDKYLKHKLSFPPFVTNNSTFDNELCHIILQMVADTVDVGEIARKNEADSLMIQRTIDSLIDYRILLRKDGFTHVSFPIVHEQTAEAARVMADSLAARLAPILTKNLSGLPKLRDSLVKAGMLSKDTNDFIGGGQIAYFPYPLIAGMVLWTNLGQRFILREGPVALIDRNDPCESANPKYLCAVAGGDYLNGSQYFHLNIAGPAYEIDFGGRIPKVNCPGMLNADRNLMEHLGWRFPQEEIAETFIFDTKVLTPLMDYFEKEPRPVIADYEKKFESLCTGAKLEPNEALRYWFWNLTATATTARMVKAGTIKPSANQQYKFTMKRGM